MWTGGWLRSQRKQCCAIVAAAAAACAVPNGNGPPAPTLEASPLAVVWTVLSRAFAAARTSAPPTRLSTSILSTTLSAVACSGPPGPRQTSRWRCHSLRACTPRESASAKGSLKSADDDGSGSRPRGTIANGERDAIMSVPSRAPFATPLLTLLASPLTRPLTSPSISIAVSPPSRRAPSPSQWQSRSACASSAIVQRSEWCLLSVSLSVDPAILPLSSLSRSALPTARLHSTSLSEVSTLARATQSRAPHDRCAAVPASTASGAWAGGAPVDAGALGAIAGGASVATE